MNYTPEEEMVLDFIREKNLYFEFNDIGKHGELNFCLERLPLDIGGKEFFFYLTTRPPFVGAYINAFDVRQSLFTLSQIEALSKEDYMEIIITDGDDDE